MELPITTLYAGALAIVFGVLSLQVIRCRRSGFGDENHPKNWQLQRAIRGHGNFSEYTPIVLILMLVMEAGGASATALHILGSGFLVGRIMHAIAFSTEKGVMNFRQIGTVLTFLALFGGAIYVLFV